MRREAYQLLRSGKAKRKWRLGTSVSLQVVPPLWISAALWVEN